MSFAVREKRMAYIEILLAFSIIPLFLTAHYLHTIDKLSENMVWAGSDTDNLMTDFVLYLAIFLTVILFILIFHRNFVIRGIKERNMSFVEYKGDKTCIICGSDEKLVINRNEKKEIEIVLCEKCVNNFKILFK